MSKPEMEDVIKQFYSGEGINLKGFGHAVDGPYASTVSTKQNTDGSYTVKLKKLDPQVMIQSKRKQKGLDMKHKVTVILCIITILVTTYLTVTGIHHYQHYKAQQAAQAAAALASEKQKSFAQQVIFNHELDQLKAQCTKDQATYNALTPALKAKTVAPDCTTNLVQ